MINTDRIWIDPPRRLIPFIATVMRAQGDGRGFIVNNTLILFDSYGATHSTMWKYLIDKKLIPNYEHIDFIIQKNGDIAVNFRTRPTTFCRTFSSPISETLTYLARQMQSPKFRQLPLVWNYDESPRRVELTRTRITNLLEKAKP